VDPQSSCNELLAGLHCSLDGAALQAHWAYMVPEPYHSSAQSAVARIQRSGACKEALVFLLIVGPVALAVSYSQRSSIPWRP